MKSRTSTKRLPPPARPDDGTLTEIRGEVRALLGDGAHHVVAERVDEALEAAKLANRLMPDTALAQYGLSFALTAAGRVDEAAALADEMEERSKAEYVKPMFLGLANVAARRFDKALEYFEIAVDERDPWLVWLGTDAKYAPLRDDPRFLSLLERSRKRFENGRVVSFQPIRPWPDRSSPNARGWRRRFGDLKAATC